MYHALLVSDSDGLHFKLEVCGNFIVVLAAASVAEIFQQWTCM